MWRRRVILASLVCSAATAAPAPVCAAAGNVVSAENALQGSSAWVRPRAYGPRIEGFTSAVSVAPGERLELHVGTSPAASYRIEIYRIGWYGGRGARLIACIPADCSSDESGTPQPGPVVDPVTGEVRASWPVTDAIPVGSDWTSGYYLAELVLTRGGYGGTAYSIPFVVRAPVTATPSAILVVAPSNTWQAYNDWGGNSLYVGTLGHAAYKVSFDRPGVTDHSGLQWEIPLVRFLEREGYDVSYVADVDVDSRPAELLRHRLDLVAGHSEYWSKAMRDGFDAARDRGTNLAFMGANDAYWQVRYEQGGRTLVAYKEAAAALDDNPDPSSLTARFRDLPRPRPECALLGVAYDGGSWGIPEQDLALNSASAGDRWFANTNLLPGAVLVGGLGGEWDNVHAGCFTGVQTVFFHFDGSPFGKPNADVVRSISPSGAIVFAAGSHQFAWGLDDFEGARYVNPGLQQFMRNALAEMTLPGAPSRLIAVRKGANVVVEIHRLNADPRVTTTVTAHAGSATFNPAAGEGTVVCTTRTSSCAVGALHGVYRFAAVATDQWGQAAAVLSGPTDLSALSQATVSRASALRRRLVRGRPLPSRQALHRP